MIRLILNRPRGLLLAFCLVVPLRQGIAQNACGCPEVCNPCSGGISVLKIKYNGQTSVLVTVFDNVLIPFTGIVGPGQSFDVLGQSNGKFSGPNIYMMVNGGLNATIFVNCSLQFDPATNYGAFSIISASSKNGGTLCCSSNNGITLPPVINGCPTDIQITAADNCKAIVGWTPPTVDGCDPIMTTDHAPGSSFDLGTTTVTYTARNASPTATLCKFNVVVKDATAPVVVTPTASATLNAGSDCKAIATWTAPVFSDNCGSVTISSTANSGATFPLGTTDVTYTAKDNAGNTTTSKFKIIVKDVVSPTVTSSTADVEVNLVTGCSANVSWQPPTFSDACSGLSKVTSNFQPGNSFPVGATEVVYTATDKSGNTATSKFNVKVKDANAPVIKDCPHDITVEASLLPGSESVVWTPPTATDDCSVLTLTSTAEPGTLFKIGTTPVIYTVEDASGNTASCSFKVNVVWESAELDVVQLVTPDANDVNDHWIIGNIEKYKENKVVIVDRWGSEVYSELNYDNGQRVWDGNSSKGSSVPTGTYFYTITIHSGPNVVEKRGFIEVVR
ncbi:MAG: HYR domain-containing protein [Chryseolinea sp.]